MPVLGVSRPQEERERANRCLVSEVEIMKRRIVRVNRTKIMRVTERPDDIHIDNHIHIHIVIPIAPLTLRKNTDTEEELKAPRRLAYT